MNVWSENAAEAADDVRAAIDAVDAQVVFVAGDPKAVGLLREHLGSRLVAERVVAVAGGRADDAAVAALRESVEEAMDTAMEASHREVLAELEDKLAGGQALQGLNAVAEALAAGRVETLLLAADRTGDPQLYAARTDPVALGTDASALGDDGTVFAAPAASVLLRSGVSARAGFTEILPSTRCEDGVAALLRF